MVSNDSYLAHYGILGMKWGVRRGSKSKRSSIKKMTDQELRERINRLQMEQQYKNLSKTKVKKGAGIAAKTLAKLTVVPVTAAVSSVVTKKLKKTISSSLDKAIAESVFRTGFSALN